MVHNFWPRTLSKNRMPINPRVKLPMFPYWNFSALDSTLFSDTPSDIRSVVYPLSSHDSYEFLVTPTWSLAIIIELDDGKIYRKTLYLMVKIMVSCRFSLKSIQWYWKNIWFLDEQRTSREEAMGIHPALAMLWAFGTRGPKGSSQLVSGLQTQLQVW